MKWYHWFIIVLTQIALVAAGLWVYHLLLGETGIEPGVAITIWAAVITIVFVVFSLLTLKNIDGKISELEKLKDKQTEKFNEIESSSKAIIDSARDAKKQIVDQAELEIKKILEKSTKRQTYFDQMTCINNELMPDKRVFAFTNFLRENKEIDGIDFAYIYIGRGNAYMQLGKFENAKNDYELALKVCHPLNKVNALSALAGYYVNVRDFVKSIECLQQALELNPESATLCIDIGNSYNALQQFDEAEKYYKRALTYNPDLAEYYYNKAIQVRDQSRPVDREQIGAYLDKSIEINPIFLPAHLAKAGLFYDEKKYDKTIAELTPVIGKLFNQEILKAIALRGEAYRMSFQEPKALPDLLFVHVFEPDNIRNISNIAATLLRLSFFNEADYFVKKGLQLAEKTNNHTLDDELNKTLTTIIAMSRISYTPDSQTSEESTKTSDDQPE